MKKKLEEEKYIKIFSNKHASLQQLQLLIQLIKNPAQGIYINPGFIKNILINYYVSTDHRYHGLLLTLLAIIAVHENNSEDFHFILLKIIYLGQFDSEFLYASLSYISNFVGQYNLCNQMQEELGQNEMLGFDQIAELVEKNAEIFEDIINSDNLNEISNFYRKSCTSLQMLSCSNELAFQYFLSAQSRVSTQFMVDLWRKIFLAILCESFEKMPDCIDDIAIAFLITIFDKKSGPTWVFKKITVSNIINYIDDYSQDTKRVVFLLKTLKVFVLRPGTLNIFEKQEIGKLVIKLIFNEKKPSDIINEAMSIAKLILKLCEYDNEYLTEMTSILNQHLISSLHQEEVLNDHATVLMRFLVTENLSLVLNRLIEILMCHKKSTIVASTLGVFYPHNPQIGVGSVINVARPHDSVSDLMDAECYLYYYRLCNSRLSSDNKAEFNDLISLIANSLKKKSRHCEPAFSLMLHLLPHYSAEQAYTDLQLFNRIKISNKKRLSLAFLDCMNDTSETITVLKYLSQVGNHLLSYFDLSAPDINALVTSIINFLNMNAKNLEVVINCAELLSKILSEKENIICLPGIKLLFVENLLVVLEKEINPNYLPIIYLLYQYQSQLELSTIHLKRRQDLLVAVSQQLATSSIDDAQLFRFMLLDKVQLVDLSVLYQILPDELKQRIPFFMKEVLAVLEASLKSASPLKSWVKRVFE